MAVLKEFHNAWGAAAAFFSVKNKKEGVPALVIVPDGKIFENAVSEFSFFARGVPVLEFPPFSQAPFEEARPLTSVAAKRAEALWAATSHSDFIMVATPYSLLKKIPPKKDYLSAYFCVEKNAILPIEELTYTLDILGYIPVEFVSGPGEFNIRGGLADIFPINSPHPVRIEYFDDETENLFFYDVETQGKISETVKVHIPPCSDVLLSTEEFISRINNETVKERAETYGKFAGYHWYAPIAGYSQEDIFSYLPQNCSVICLSHEWQEDIKSFAQSLNGFLSGNPLADVLAENFITADDAVAKIKLKNITVVSESSLSSNSFELPFKSTKPLFAFEKRNLYQSLTNSFAVINNLLNEGKKIAVSIESDKFATIFKEFARDFDIFPKEIDSFEAMSDYILYLYRQRISGGFVDDEDKLALIADSDIFGFSRRKPKTKKKEVFNTKISDLEEGDYVVHVNHGVGIYRGIRHLTIAGVEGDFLDILYDGDDILYVPLHSISQIQKYVGLQDQKPKLNSLKSSAWIKLKKNARENAKHIAEDLLRLYAERKAVKGFAFINDDSVLNDFESDFEYDETEDQLSAIIDVYKDMESDTPMERLVCGDVGFGKTEVAMRAACKAVSCGKQVAVLVPTTILARQHYETFKKRFSKLPVNIDFVSRFRSTKEIREIYEKASKGTIDIIIGTHKILSKNLTFKDLGLLVIDEEQRFGVSHKEKIAAMKRGVDTLTLSATPIPRTLQLSLSGIRDMSIIETPPENRLPVVVKVVKGDDGISKAITAELERGGQVFFLHNKVADIHEVAAKVKNMLPYARVDYAHGQMDAQSLENILQSFYSGDIDILVSTTIIENGIDIPNVNTIVINNAANFGLAQLYQLKGRVGRSSRRGYCILAVNNFSTLSHIAQKRLSIIQQLSDLGSGFKIAMYDLQLRGAGDILGAEQSGFVAKVGYELYVSMIEEAVNEIKGEITGLADTEINSNIPYFIPADYVSDPRARFDFYRRFADIYDSHSMNELLHEIEAGFGELRQEVVSLGYIMLIKNLSGRLGASKVLISQGGGKIQFLPETALSPEIISKAACAKSGKIIYRFSSEYELSLAVDDKKPPMVLAEFFESMYNMSTLNSR